VCGDIGSAILRVIWWDGKKHWGNALDSRVTNPADVERKCLLALDACRRAVIRDPRGPALLIVHPPAAPLLPGVSLSRSILVSPPTQSSRQLWRGGPSAEAPRGRLLPQQGLASSLDRPQLARPSPPSSQDPSRKIDVTWVLFGNVIILL